MNDSVTEAMARDEPVLEFAPAALSPARGLARLLRARVLDQARDLRDCQLRVIDADGDVVLGTPAADASSTLHTTVWVRDPAFYRQLALNGSTGAGEAFMDGCWECSDLTVLVRILVRNRDHLDAMEGGFARFAGWLMRAAHVFTRNTRGGSRRNIAAHYDLGNALFELFLDDSMMYSAPGESLESAQRRKLDRICRKLQLGPDDHVIEIGSGWGGFAIHAARHYGCRVTTTTISREQHEYATQRVQAVGLGERINVLQQDYRDLTGRYDKLCPSRWSRPSAINTSTPTSRSAPHCCMTRAWR